jgi:hypothetical protein
MHLPDGLIKVSNLSIHVYAHAEIATPLLVETLDMSPPATGKYFNRSYVDHSMFAVSPGAVRSSRTYRLICTWALSMQPLRYHLVGPGLKRWVVS